MFEHLLIAAHLLVPGKVSPRSKLGFGRGGRRHDMGRFVGPLRHPVSLAGLSLNKKAPAKPGPLISRNRNLISANRIRRSDAAPSALRTARPTGRGCG